MRIPGVITIGVLSVAGVYILIAFLFYYFQESQIFFPETLPQEFVFKYENRFEEFNFEPETGVKISALLFQTDDPEGIVYYFHGNAGSLRDWGEVADEFLFLGYDVMIYDYRGYGKSSGKMSEASLYSDGLYLYNEIMKKYPEEKIILYGRSLGTAVAAYIASVKKPFRLILESPFFSGPDIARHYFPWLPSFLLNYKFRNDLYLQKTECPVSIFHGTEDEIIYFGSSIKLEKKFKPGDKLFRIEGGKHNDLQNFEEYQTRLKEIL